MKPMFYFVDYDDNDNKNDDKTKTKAKIKTGNENKIKINGILLPTKISNVKFSTMLMFLC